MAEDNKQETWTDEDETRWRELWQQWQQLDKRRREEHPQMQWTEYVFRSLADEIISQGGRHVDMELIEQLNLFMRHRAKAGMPVWNYDSQPVRMVSQLTGMSADKVLCMAWAINQPTELMGVIESKLGNERQAYIHDVHTMVGGRWS